MTMVKKSGGRMVWVISRTLTFCWARVWVTEAMNGFGMTVQVTEELCSKRSEFQKIDVYQTSKLGRMLLLDGIIQLTEFDEFAYHEMLAHIPLFAHENPKRLLVVGGGDGSGFGACQALDERKRSFAIKRRLVDICWNHANVIARFAHQLDAAR